MKRLLKLADKIKDKKLRKDVVDFIKDVEPTHPEFSMALSLEDTPAAANTRQANPGGLIEHTISVTELAEKFAQHFNKMYKIGINVDFVVAAAILHDLYKSVEFGIENNQYVTSEICLNHLNLMIAEMYKRKFSKEIIHIIAAHFGENCPTPPLTYEALCLYYADTYESIIATNVAASKQIEKQMQQFKTIVDTQEKKE